MYISDFYAMKRKHGSECWVCIQKKIAPVTEMTKKSSWNLLVVRYSQFLLWLTRCFQERTFCLTPVAKTGNRQLVEKNHVFQNWHQGHAIQENLKTSMKPKIMFLSWWAVDICIVSKRKATSKTSYYDIHHILKMFWERLFGALLKSYNPKRRMNINKKSVLSFTRLWR